ncbi:MAG: MoaD/ThiS family protein [Bacillota bacterium]
MVRVTVRFIGHLAALARTREQVFEPDPPVLEELFRQVDRATGGRLAGELYQAGDRQQLHKANIFLINGREARFLAGLQTALDDGAVVTFMPPLVGG